MSIDQERLIDCLRTVAEQRRTITYAALCQAASVPPPHAIHRLTAALEALLRADWSRGHASLGSLAVSRARNGLPGRGYFQLARQLGRYAGALDHGHEAEAFHRREVTQVWARQEPAPR